MPLIENVDEWEKHKSILENDYYKVIGEPEAYPCWVFIAEIHSPDCAPHGYYEIGFVYLDENGVWDLARMEKEVAWSEWKI